MSPVAFSLILVQPKRKPPGTLASPLPKWLSTRRSLCPQALGESNRPDSGCGSCWGRGPRRGVGGSRQGPGAPHRQARVDVLSRGQEHCVTCVTCPELSEGPGLSTACPREQWGLLVASPMSLSSKLLPGFQFRRGDPRRRPLAGPAAQRPRSGLGARRLLEACGGSPAADPRPLTARTSPSSVVGALGSLQGGALALGAGRSPVVVVPAAPPPGSGLRTPRLWSQGASISGPGVQAEQRPLRPLWVGDAALCVTWATGGPLSPSATPRVSSPRAQRGPAAGQGEAAGPLRRAFLPAGLWPEHVGFLGGMKTLPDATSCPRALASSAARFWLFFERSLLRGGRSAP